MREIKFRGKREGNGDWVFGSFIPDALERSNSDLISWGFIRRYNRGIGKMETIEVDRETVGQLIGLKDKNGVEIYEGDVVQCENYHGSVSGDIKFFRGAFYLNCSSGQSDEYLFNCSNIEVIGNIHDKENE